MLARSSPRSTPITRRKSCRLANRSGPKSWLSTSKGGSFADSGLELGPEDLEGFLGGGSDPCKVGKRLSEYPVQRIEGGLSFRTQGPEENCDRSAFVSWRSRIEKSFRFHFR
jgi:hypothetical protein